MLQHNNLNIEIAKTRLKESAGNTKYVEKNNVAYFKPTVLIIFLIYTFSILLLGFWGTVFYDFFIEDLKFIEDMPWFFYIMFILLGLILSIAFMIPYSDYKTKRSFNKKTGRFRLGDSSFSKKGKKLKNIIAIQIIGYQEHRKIPTNTDTGGSVKALFTFFQLIIVMKNKDRYLVATYRNRDKILEIANKLSKFLEQPILDEIKNFEGVDEETKSLSKNFSSRITLTDYFEIDITKDELLKRLNSKDYYDIIELENNIIKIDPEPIRIYNTNLGYYIRRKPFENICAYIYLSQKQDILQVNLSTKFRYEFLIYTSISLILVLLEFSRVTGIIGIILTGLVWWLQRSNEKSLFRMIKEHMTLSNKVSNIVN
ncbi:hypothetical protein [Aquimarina sp. MMG016]|uniref:hypothetical protein n=1 Tax=Aquimarina sp. MMG016 TaxID=2822690 RepID=UPI001B3A2076|nr:hypothetical protein [Aquimarina sp. MMG016]MBQ4819932.1 hypothetical protein [Aquimarina sp. MMG016]